MAQTDEKAPSLLGVLAVAVLLGTFAYLTSDWMARYPFRPLLSLITNLEDLGFTTLRDGEHLTNDLWMVWFRPENKMSYDNQRRLLFGTIFAAFLGTSFLPGRMRRPFTVVLTVGALAVLLGWLTAGLLLVSLGSVYLFLHRPALLRKTTLGFLVCAATLFLYQSNQDETWFAYISAVGGFGLIPFYAVLSHLPENRLWRLASSMAVHSVWWMLLLAALCQQRGLAFAIPIGIILQFWLWERLVFYAIDFRDGVVPEELSWSDFYATFLSPAMLVNMSWLNRIGKGYLYLQERYLARPHSKVVWSGIWLMTLSLGFMLVKMPILDGLWLGFRALEVEPMSLESAVYHLEKQWTVSIGSIWCALLTDFLRFYLTWTVIAHFKVAVWRLLGYDILPHFQSPFLSTNLVELWRRYSYYYREFLVAAFFYPVFLGLRGYPRWLRTAAATMAAACGGNFIFHLMEALLYSGGAPVTISQQLRTLPYFLIFGLTITLTSFYLTKSRSNKPSWSDPRRYILDVLSVVGIFGFYILVRVLRHVPDEHSYEVTWRLLGGAFGL